MQQSPCDVTAYHAYNGSEIASSKMQNIASSYNWVVVSEKNIKNIYKFHTIQTFIFTKKTKNDFCHESPPLRRVHMDTAKWIECAFNPVCKRSHLLKSNAHRMRIDSNPPPEVD